MVAPILEELAVEYEGRVTVTKLNVDENRQTPTQFGIRSIPTILFFKDGSRIDQVIGALPKSAIRTKIQQHL
jgi:thioredoxin 1